MDRVHDWALELGLKVRPRVAQLLGRTQADAPQSRPSESAIYQFLCESSFSQREREQFSEVWDVGCRNWSYAPTLANTFPNAKLVGVEVDPDRLYLNLTTRKSAAQSVARSLQQSGCETRLEFADFRNCDLSEISPETLFLFLFPFVSEAPCRQGGLPARFSDFSELLRPIREHVLRAPVLSCHQGEWEAEEARLAYQRAGFSVLQERIFTEVTMHSWGFPYPIAVFLASKG